MGVEKGIRKKGGFRGKPKPLECQHRGTGEMDQFLKARLTKKSKEKNNSREIMLW